MPDSIAPLDISSRAWSAVSELISESGSFLSRRTPLTSLRKTSFSAPIAWATAVAAVSALTFSFCPLASRHIDGMTGTMPTSQSRLIDLAVGRRDRADVAQVDRLRPFVARQRQPLAEQHVRGAEVQRLGLAAEFLDVLGESFVGFVGQHPLDDVQRGVVGIAAALDEAAAAGRPRPSPG